MSVLPRSEQPLRAEDQDQHEEQVGQDRGDLRDGELEHGVAEGLLRHRHADGPQRARQGVVERHGEGLHQPDDQRGEEGAGERAHAAHDDHDEDDRADRRGHRRLGDVGVAADHAGQPGQRAAAAEHQHEHARHVVAQRLHHLGLLERGLDDEADARAGEHQPHRHQHEHRHQHHERARLGELRAVQREERPLQLRRQAIGHGGAAPDELHDLQDQVREAEGHEQFRHVAELVHAPQRIALEGGAQCAHDQRREEERGPEAHYAGDRIGEVGAEHVEAGVREIEHAHHAEDQRQPGAQHEQQEPVAHAVEQGDDEKLEVHRNQAARRCGKAKGKGQAGGGAREGMLPGPSDAKAPRRGRAVRKAASSGTRWACSPHRARSTSRARRCSPYFPRRRGTCRPPSPTSRRRGPAAAGGRTCASPPRR